MHIWTKHEKTWHFWGPVDGSVVLIWNRQGGKGWRNMLVKTSTITTQPALCPDPNENQLWATAFPCYCWPQRDPYPPHSVFLPVTLLQFGTWSRRRLMKEQLKKKLPPFAVSHYTHLLYMIFYVPQKYSFFRAFKTNETFISITFILSMI